MAFTEKKETETKIEIGVKCDKSECRYHAGGGKCTLENCFYDDTEWKLGVSKISFTCRTCGKQSSVDARSTNDRICSSCIKLIKNTITLSGCRLCGGKINTQYISPYCSSCESKLRSIINLYDSGLIP